MEASLPAIPALPLAGIIERAMQKVEEDIARSRAKLPKAQDIAQDLEACKVENAKLEVRNNELTTGIDEIRKLNDKVFARVKRRDATIADAYESIRQLVKQKEALLERNNTMDAVRPEGEAGVLVKTESEDMEVDGLEQDVKADVHTFVKKEKEQGSSGQVSEVGVDDDSDSECDAYTDPLPVLPKEGTLTRADYETSSQALKDWCRAVTLLDSKGIAISEEGQIGSESTDLIIEAMREIEPFAGKFYTHLKYFVKCYMSDVRARKYHIPPRELEAWQSMAAASTLHYGSIYAFYDHLQFCGEHAGAETLDTCKFYASLEVACTRSSAQRTSMKLPLSKTVNPVRFRKERHAAVKIAELENECDEFLRCSRNKLGIQGSRRLYELCVKHIGSS